MKTTILTIFAVAVSLSLIACNESATTNTAAKPANAANGVNTANSGTAVNPAAIEADIKKLIADYASSTQKNDADAYANVTSDNFMFVSNDGTVQTKAERIASMKSGSTKYETLRYDDISVRVNAEGNGAVAIAKATVKGTNNGKPIDATVRVTQVWSKTKDGWKLASLHATNIAPESTSAKPDVKNEEANKSAANK